jgi:glutamate 5-kinase
VEKSLKYREIIPDARRLVVKIGSRVLVRKTGRPDACRMKTLVGQLAALHRSGRDIVVVTSGAVGAGTEALGMRARPTLLPDLQMAAAVGQSRLMSRYDALFSAAGCTVGQVLLTHDDFHHKIRLINARRTMENLLRHRVIPVVNENDVVADEEIRADMALGDNDLLAALVVRLVRADLLVLLTTVEGLLRFGPSGRAQRVRYLEAVTRRTLAMATGSGSPLSKGGMLSKLKAAHMASQAGCGVVIANGRSPDVLTRVLRGDDVGTLVLAEGL